MLSSENKQGPKVVSIERSFFRIEPPYILILNLNGIGFLKVKEQVPFKMRNIISAVLCKKIGQTA